MNAASSLLRLDWWRTRNSLREIVRKPSRALMWLFFLLWLASLVFMRSAHGAAIFHVRGGTATIAGAIALVVLGINVVTAGGTQLATQLDLVMLERSAIAEGTILAWLSLRAFFTRSFRGFFVLAALAIAHTRSNAFDAALALIALATLVHFVSVPAMLVRMRAPLITTLAGGTLAIVGLGVGIVGWLAPARDPGIATIVTALWDGSPIALGVTFGLALFCWICAFGARDIFADLYERARKGATLRERLRARRQAGHAGAVTVSAATTPPGAASLLWKRLIFLRRKNGPQLAAGGLAAGLAIGIAAGILSFRRPDAASAILIAIPIAVASVSFFTSAALGDDLSRPIWWMGDGSLVSKLAWDALGSVLPYQLVALVALVTAAAIERNTMLLLAGGLASVAVPLALRTIGTFAYTIAPSPVDQRGPAMVLRLLLFYAAIILCVVAATATTFLLHSFTAGLIAAAAVLLALAVIALAFAARRIEGRGIELARAEGT